MQPSSNNEPLLLAEAEHRSLAVLWHELGSRVSLSSIRVQSMTALTPDITSAQVLPVRAGGLCAALPAGQAGLDEGPRQRRRPRAVLVQEDGPRRRVHPGRQPLRARGHPHRRPLLRCVRRHICLWQLNPMRRHAASSFAGACSQLLSALTEQTNLCCKVWGCHMTFGVNPIAWVAHWRHVAFDLTLQAWLATAACGTRS